MRRSFPSPELAGRIGTLRRRFVLGLQVQAGGRTTLLAVVDGFLLIQGVFAALLWGGRAADFYRLTALVPVVLLGPLVLSDLIAVEKRSGSLDLTLTLGSRDVTFLMRTSSIAALMWMQAGLVMAAVWLIGSVPVRLFGSLLQLAAVSGLIAATALFWSLHLRGAGATWLATVATLAALGKWTFSNPTSSLTGGPVSSTWLGPVGGVLGTAAVEVGITLLLVAYATRRLHRAEAILR